MMSKSEQFVRHMDAQTPAGSGSGTPSVGELLNTHPGYRADLLEQYSVWYKGGHVFQEALCADDDGTYLVRRQADGETVGSGTYRALRKNRAQYVSEVGRIITSITATILKNAPQLASKDEHVRELNHDADGIGTDLRELSRQILVAGFVQKRAYLGPTFPTVPTDGMDLAQAKDAGALDGKLRFYDAVHVIDWSRADDGRLNMVRVYGTQDARARGSWGAIKHRKHRWTIIDDADVTTYEYVQERWKNGRLKPIAKTDLAEFKGTTAHGFDRMPLREFIFARDFWLMDRLVDAQKRLFNSEADEAFIRSETAHPQRVLLGDPKMEPDANGNMKVLASPVHGIQLPEGAGDYKMVGPDAASAPWHEKAIERDRRGLYAALEALYLGLSSQGQNARQAASAKAIDRSDATLFLSFAATSLEEMILGAAGDIANKRGASEDVRLDGLNDIDGRPISAAIADSKEYLDTKPPEAAERWVKKQLAARVCAGAPEEVCKEIEKELDKPMPKPVVPPAFPPAVPVPPVEQDENSAKEEPEPDQE